MEDSFLAESGETTIISAEKDDLALAVHIASAEEGQTMISLGVGKK